MNKKLIEILEAKKREVERLKLRYSEKELKAEIQPINFNVYNHLRGKKALEGHFFISEFKRKSPSEGTINQWVHIEDQLKQYLNAGAAMVSVLTDTPFFGGDYRDLKEASIVLRNSGTLLLQKDFIIDPIQILLARKMGAHCILLIARILGASELKSLKAFAEALGMGVLVEIHNLEEYEKVAGLDCELLGVNNRDLDTFSTYVNRFNVISDNLPKKSLLVSESGLKMTSDALMLKDKADGFLVGTSLMKSGVEGSFVEHFGLNRAYIFKACGLRQSVNVFQITADLKGFNFSPISKRAISEDELNKVALSSDSVAVFKENSEEEILDIITKYSFGYAQIYVDDISNPNFLNQLKCKVILAGSVNNEAQYQKMIQLANYADLFILDGPLPGSGMEAHNTLFKDFPFPFLKAGGVNASNINQMLELPNCIGIDVASGIETDGVVDLEKIEAINTQIQALKKSVIC